MGIVASDVILPISAFYPGESEGLPESPENSLRGTVFGDSSVKKGWKCLVQNFALFSFGQVDEPSPDSDPF